MCVCIFRVTGVDVCMFYLQVRVCVWALHGHWLHSPELSFHSEKAFAGKSSLDSFSSSQTSCCWLKRPGIFSMGSHPFNQPTRILWEWAKGLATSRSKGLNICSGNEQDWVKMQPSYWPEEVGLQQSKTFTHNCNGLLTQKYILVKVCSLTYSLQHQRQYVGNYIHITLVLITEVKLFK